MQSIQESVPGKPGAFFWIFWGIQCRCQNPILFVCVCRLKNQTICLSLTNFSMESDYNKQERKWQQL
ncbi:hypothetical protein D7X87_02235 [bacterium D16-54]|nr:hypothetical protein D7X87_02235 [bacterium D16-54]RKJ16469.1 hypothetical protein D7X65_02235 [bacterium D16-56]